MSLRERIADFISFIKYGKEGIGNKVNYITLANVIRKLGPCNVDAAIKEYSENDPMIGEIVIPEVEENISILNFHYNWPESVEWNYGYNKVIGFDESGFAGSGDKVYRRQAWRFILSGGGLFNNLDYSFFSGYEDGTLENDAPGGGSATLRKQLKILSDFIHGFDIVKLSPDHSTIIHAPGVIPYIMSDPGKEYAVFLQSVTESSAIEMDLPAGRYSIKHMNPINGETVMEETLQVGDAPAILNVNLPEWELALDIRKVQ